MLAANTCQSDATTINYEIEAKMHVEESIGKSYLATDCSILEVTEFDYATRRKEDEPEEEIKIEDLEALGIVIDPIDPDTELPIPRKVTVFVTDD